MSQKANNIILIGMSGVGKSTVGKIVAHALEWDFVDIDRELEGAHGMSLQEILDTNGKDEFIKMEADFLNNILNNDHQVIAPGGSIVYATNIMMSAGKRASICYLEADIKTIKSRIKKNNRGIVGLKESNFEDLYLERQSLYQKFSENTFAAERKNPDEIALEIVKSVSV